ncbi:hypothetical protein ACIPSA_46210 [Streptomyces sp. NPDC086549]|uniref:hypothetical protein n=1 Tax=Streptomyces sp. NPDC086549 TaxID=3365752 RepID=UPI0038021ACA
MSSQHRDPPLTVRPPATLKADAQKELTNRGREMKAFIVACLNALVADPDGFLNLLNEHWPAETPRGRPRKTAEPEPSAHSQRSAPPKAHHPWDDEAPNAFDALNTMARDEDTPNDLEVLDETAPD